MGTPSSKSPSPESLVTTDRSRRSILLRAGLSLLILFQVVAIFVPPFTFCTSGMRPTEGSPFALSLMRVFRPYCEFTFLNHGYAFFAPDPGPSHLVRAHLEFDDQRPGQDVIFPNLKEHWPRLLYHRHFMMSEQLNQRFEIPQLPADVPQDSPQYRNWRHSRNIYEALTRSYENHLRKKHGASSAVLTRIEHRLLIPDEFERDEMGITNPRLYVDLLENPAPLPPGGRP